MRNLSVSNLRILSYLSTYLVGHSRRIGRYLILGGLTPSWLLVWKMHPSIPQDVNLPTEKGEIRGEGLCGIEGGLSTTVPTYVHLVGISKDFYPNTGRLVGLSGQEHFLEDGH